MSNVRATSLAVRDPCRTRTLGGDGFGVGVGVGRGVARGVGRAVGRGVGGAVGFAVGRIVGRGVGRAVGDGFGEADGVTGCDALGDGDGHGSGAVEAVGLGPAADGRVLGVGRQLAVALGDAAGEADVPGPQATTTRLLAMKIAMARFGSLNASATTSPGRFDRSQHARPMARRWMAIRHERSARTARPGRTSRHRKQAAMPVARGNGHLRARPPTGLSQPLNRPRPDRAR
jgi:hypothetical protein